MQNNKKKMWLKTKKNQDIYYLFISPKHEAAAQPDATENHYFEYLLQTSWAHSVTNSNLLCRGGVNWVINEKSAVFNIKQRKQTENR